MSRVLPNDFSFRTVQVSRRLRDGLPNQSFHFSLVRRLSQNFFQVIWLRPGYRASKLTRSRGYLGSPIDAPRALSVSTPLCARSGLLQCFDFSTEFISLAIRVRGRALLMRKTRINNAEGYGLSRIDGSLCTRDQHLFQSSQLVFYSSPSATKIPRIKDFKEPVIAASENSSRKMIQSETREPLR